MRKIIPQNEDYKAAATDIAYFPIYTKSLVGEKQCDKKVSEFTVLIRE